MKGKSLSAEPIMNYCSPTESIADCIRAGCLRKLRSGRWLARGKRRSQEPEAWGRPLAQHLEGSRFIGRQFYRSAAGGSRKPSRMFAPAQDPEALPRKHPNVRGSGKSGAVSGSRLLQSYKTADL